jgi:putative methyltransferase (TIGR04325 family)
MLDGALELPLIGGLRRKRFDAAFAAGRYAGRCRGVFDTYAECLAAVPTSMPTGYDNEAMSGMYRDRLARIYPGDYPALLWLGKAFADGATRVFDLGGHVGIGYYAYRRYIDYPAGLSWQVHDVPAVMEAGRALARERDAWNELGFVDAAGAADAAAGSDVLFTSGCIQYLEETVAERIGKLARRPRWVIVNLLPLHESQAYWTVQSTGKAFCPYRIQKTDDFLSALGELGYRTMDLWENAEKRCNIVFAPQLSLDRYFGVALRLE